MGEAGLGFVQILSNVAALSSPLVAPPGSCLTWQPSLMASHFTWGSETLGMFLVIRDSSSVSYLFVYWVLLFILLIC